MCCKYPNCLYLRQFQQNFLLPLENFCLADANSKFLPPFGFKNWRVFRFETISSRRLQRSTSAIRPFQYHRHYRTFSYPTLARLGRTIPNPSLLSPLTPTSIPSLYKIFGTYPKTIRRSPNFFPIIEI